MRSSCCERFPGNACNLSRTAATVLGGFFCLVLWVPLVSASSSAAKREQARAYYEQAQEARSTLQETPVEQRTPRQYEKVIRTFRRVYLTAPSYSNNPRSLMAIGELYQEMGRRWEQPKYFRAAMEAYEFLLREYPYSPHRWDALLAVARIYRGDLGQPEEALKQFQRTLDSHPNSSQAEEARQAIAEIHKELETRQKELEARQKEAAEEAAAASSKADLPENRARNSGAPQRVTNIRHWGTSDSTRVVIDVEGEVKYRVGRLDTPPRIYLDLFGTRVTPPISRQTFTVEDSLLLKRVRARQYRDGVTRVVLDVGELGDYSVSELPNPFRLVVDLHNRSKEPTTLTSEAPAADKGSQIPPEAAASPKADGNPVAPAKAETKTEPVEVVKIKTPPAVEKKEPSPGLGEVAKPKSPPVVPKAKVARPNRDGARSLTRALGLKIGRIILDPGHGGHDTGTIGPAGLYEKDLVLDVAQRLGKIIEERLGSEVIYSRQDDTFVPLESRTALANEKQADLFLSIHANSSRSQRARGVETYYLNFTTDPEALEVAARENAVSQETVYQLPDLVKKIALQEKVDESKEFASRVQTELRKSVAPASRRRIDRGVKKAPFAVLIGAKMPSILAEISFLSNPQDEKLLQTSQYRQKIAGALYAGIVKYVDTLSGVKVARSQNENAPIVSK